MIKIFNYSFHKRSLFQIFLDLGLVLIAVVTSFLSLATDPASDSAAVLTVALLLGVGVLAINTGLGFYQGNRVFTPSQMRLRALLSLAFTLPLAYGVYRVSPLRPQDEKAFLLALVFAMILMLIHRIYVSRSNPKGLNRQRVLVYGSGPRAKLVGSMLNSLDPSVDLVGYYVGPNEQKPDSIDYRMLPSDTSLTDLVSKEGVDEIVVALSERRGGQHAASRTARLQAARHQGD